MTKLRSTHSRTAIVVGASSGIGEALARALDREGWRLALLARRSNRLEVIARELQPGTVFRHIDIANDRVAAATLDQLIDDLGGFHPGIFCDLKGARTPPRY